VAFSAEELSRIDSLVGELCRRITVDELRDQLEFVMEADTHAVTIQEVRPAFQDPSKRTKHGVARFRYFRSRDEWRLYWMRQDLKRHVYEPAEEIYWLDELVAIVEADDYCCFFG
jgi:hypothetical protein